MSAHGACLHACAGCRPCVVMLCALSGLPLVLCAHLCNPQARDAVTPPPPPARCARRSLGWPRASPTLTHPRRLWRRASRPSRWASRATRPTRGPRRCARPSVKSSKVGGRRGPCRREVPSGLGRGQRHRLLFPCCVRSCAWVSGGWCWCLVGKQHAPGGDYPGINERPGPSHGHPMTSRSAAPDSEEGHPPKGQTTEGGSTGALRPCHIRVRHR